jgi:hypothetical protein
MKPTYRKHKSRGLEYSSMSKKELDELVKDIERIAQTNEYIPLDQILKERKIK